MSNSHIKQMNYKAEPVELKSVNPKACTADMCHVILPVYDICHSFYAFSGFGTKQLPHRWGKHFQHVLGYLHITHNLVRGN